jgi:hypothetical protein
MKKFYFIIGLAFGVGALAFLLAFIIYPLVIWIFKFDKK